MTATISVVYIIYNVKITIIGTKKWEVEMEEEEEEMLLQRLKGSCGEKSALLCCLHLPFFRQESAPAL